MRRGGQSLLELAVALPVLLILAFGAAALLRLADAKSGLDGATAAAAADAARQSSWTVAVPCGTARFQAIVAGYPLLQPRLTVSGTFSRGTYLNAAAIASVDLSFVPLSFLPRQVHITAHARALVEPWRSRESQPCDQYSTRTG